MLQGWAGAPGALLGCWAASSQGLFLHPSSETVFSDLGGV